MNTTPCTIDFFGEVRNYQEKYDFNDEWNIKLYANDIEGAIKTLSILTEWALSKVDNEIDYQNINGHIICKKIRTL